MFHHYRDKNTGEYVRTSPLTGLWWDLRGDSLGYGWVPTMPPSPHSIESVDQPEVEAYLECLQLQVGKPTT